MHARIAAVLAMGLAYIGLSHWLMTDRQPSGWNAVVVLGPMLGAIALGAWRAGQRLLACLSAFGIAALCAQALLGRRVPPELLYLAQHAGINLFLAVCFGGTLRPGHTALVTHIAARVHRDFTPAMARYTRKVTAAWTLYFAAMAALSLLVYALASFETWALFANVLTPLAVAAMFGGEHLLRYRLHPEFERASMADAIRSYMHGGQPAAPRDTAR